MRLTKIYTKVGDRGKTLLASGEKVSKTDLRIEAYGSVDELNSFMGLLRDELSEQEDLFKDIIAEVQTIQNELFDIGGELSTPSNVLDINRQQVVSMASVSRLEQQIDHFNENLKPLENFVIPGGHRLNSTAHIARTVCRRAERHAVAFSSMSTCRTEPLIYLNRLSDWLFVICRLICHRLEIPEIQWQQKKN